MNGGPEIRIGRLVIEGRVISREEAGRLGRLVAEALARGPWPAPRVVDTVVVRPGAGALSLDRLAGQIAAEIRGQLG